MGLFSRIKNADLLPFKSVILPYAEFPALSLTGPLTATIFYSLDPAIGPLGRDRWNEVLALDAATRREAPPEQGDASGFIEAADEMLSTTELLQTCKPYLTTDVAREWTDFGMRVARAEKASGVPAPDGKISHVTSALLTRAPLRLETTAEVLLAQWITRVAYGVERMALRGVNSGDHNVLRFELDARLHVVRQPFAEVSLPLMEQFTNRVRPTTSRETILNALANNPKEEPFADYFINLLRHFDRQFTTLTTGRGS